jgi:hypothetical protein
MKGAAVDLGRWPIEELWLAYIDDPEHHLIMPHVGGRVTFRTGTSRSSNG